MVGFEYSLNMNIYGSFRELEVRIHENKNMNIQGLKQIIEWIISSRRSRSILAIMKVGILNNACKNIELMMIQG